MRALKGSKEALTTLANVINGKLGDFVGFEVPVVNDASGHDGLGV